MNVCKKCGCKREPQGHSCIGALQAAIAFEKRRTQDAAELFQASQRDRAAEHVEHQDLTRQRELLAKRLEYERAMHLASESHADDLIDKVQALEVKLERERIVCVAAFVGAIVGWVTVVMMLA